MDELLICTDLDRTLIPNGAQPESPAARPIFSALVAGHGIHLAYVSGRHAALIREAIEAYGLPLPDFAIADVGATIWQVVDGGWQRWPAWDAAIGSDWRGESREQLHELLADIDLLRLQEAEKQSRFKLSYYLPLGSNRRQVMGEIERRLQDAGIAANLIWSVDEIEGVGLLDILPASANKLHAIRFLMQQGGFDEQQTVFAGDSGNDLDVMLASVPSILVANADAEVRGHALASGSGLVYFAAGGYLGMNGNYAAGILEGLAALLPQLRLRIEAAAKAVATAERP